MSNFLPFLSLPFRLSLVKDPPDRDAVLEITYTKPDTTVKTSGWCYQEAQRKSGVAPLSKLHFPQFSFLIPGMTLTSRRMADSSCDLSFQEGLHLSLPWWLRGLHEVGQWRRHFKFSVFVPVPQSLLVLKNPIYGHNSVYMGCSQPRPSPSYCFCFSLMGRNGHPLTYLWGFKDLFFMKSCWKEENTPTQKDMLVLDTQLSRTSSTSGELLSDVSAPGRQTLFLIYFLLIFQTGKESRKKGGGEREMD